MTAPSSSKDMAEFVFKVHGHLQLTISCRIKAGQKHWLWNTRASHKLSKLYRSETLAVEARGIDLDFAEAFKPNLGDPRSKDMDI